MRSEKYPVTPTQDELDTAATAVNNMLSRKDVRQALIDYIASQYAYIRFYSNLVYIKETKIE